MKWFMVWMLVWLAFAADDARAQIYKGQAGYTLLVMDARVNGVPAAMNASGKVAGTTSGAAPETAFVASGATLTLLGTLGGPTSAGVAIDGRGRVAGYSVTASGETHAFIGNATRLEDLGTLGGTLSFATAMNTAGRVTGTSTDPAGWQHAFVTRGSQLVDYGTLPGATIVTPTAINCNGRITGIVNYPDAPPLGYHVFISRGTRLVDLGTLGGYTGVSTAINNRDQLTGFSNTATQDQHAFLSDGATLTDLGTLGGTTSAGYAINEAGQVAGYATTGSGKLHAFVTDGTRLVDLGNAGYDGSVATAINDRGEVTGYLIAGGEHAQDGAFLYRDGKLIDLNTLLTREVAARYTLEEGLSINDRGQILVVGSLKSDSAFNVTMVLSPAAADPADPVEQAATPAGPGN